ncbi:MAG: hypothetical protein J6R00_11035, partial [Lentisphaeria bacterium]|nr:hypothetical protein [Lentisphaeria bacterium]
HTYLGFPSNWDRPGSRLSVMTSPVAADASFFRRINSSRMAAWLVRGELSDPMLWKIILISFPFWAAGLLLGDYLHNRASEYHFKLGVYLLIGVSGVVMFLNNLRQLFS